MIEKITGRKVAEFDADFSAYLDLRLAPYRLALAYSYAGDAEGANASALTALGIGSAAAADRAEVGRGAGR